MKVREIKESKFKILQVMLFMASIVLYGFRPTDILRNWFSYICFAIIISSTVLYFSSLNKKNYLDFDTLFVMLLLIIGFAYPIFLIDQDSMFLYYYRMDLDSKRVNTGVVLFALGIQTYYMGALSVKEKRKNSANVLKFIDTRFLILSVITLTGLFIFFGGINYFQSIYRKDIVNYSSSLALQVMVLLHAVSIVVIATEFYNKRINKNYKISKLLIVTIGCMVLLMLYVGNRTFASQLILPILVLYALFFRNVNKLWLSVFFIVSVMSMSVIKTFRIGDDVKTPTSFAETFIDLLIVTKSTYYCLEYLEINGYSYGLTMSGGLSGIIPSLESNLINNYGVDKDDLGSAETLTRFVLGRERSYGLGTNIIADIYLSFGLVGVLVLMWVLGVFTRRCYLGTLNMNYFSIITYSVLVSYSVFLARTSYTHPVKLLLWCFIIGKINIFLTQKR
jgi:oligosaccharide repeat unit polymerase